MLDISFALLKQRGIEADYALSGRTALSAYYWQHRFSTDIDIFIHNGTAGDLKKIPNMQEFCEELKDYSYY